MRASILTVYHLNLYENIISPTVNNSITIEKWFNLIKQSDYSNSILAARPFGKNHKLYTDVKSAVPAVTYNFLFDNKKTNANIISGTGLMYIDVDVNSFDISSLDTSKIFSYYKSFGGNGYSILVQVSGLTIDNYSDTYSLIVNDLGLSVYSDKQAKKATQFAVLSYDPDIFINKESQVFQAGNTNEITATKPILVREPFLISDYTADANTPIRFDNLNEIKIMGNYAFNWDGWTYIRCWMPMQKVPTGKRNSMLLSYCNNLVWLNPQLTVAGAISIMKNVNNKSCEKPVSDSQINSIVNSIFKYKDSKTLNPIIDKKDRKIVFANHCGLNRDEKFAVCRELLIEKKQNESLEKLDKIINNWDFIVNGKITQSSVVKIGKMGNNTVNKYWNDFKVRVKELNDKNPLSSNVINKKKKIYTTELRVKSNKIKIENMKEVKEIKHQEFKLQELNDDTVMVSNDTNLVTITSYIDLKPMIIDFTDAERNIMYKFLMNEPAGNIFIPLNNYFCLEFDKSFYQGKVFVDYVGTFEVKRFG